MITIATLNSLNEAHLLRSMLESSEIPAFIPDENTAQADWTLINAMGGIRVQVPESFREEAKKIVADYNSN